MSEMGLKELAANRRPKFGNFVVEFATPGIGHILKSAGCDFVLFDLEHSGFGIETLKSAIRYFEAAQLPVIARTPSKDYHHIARALDMGAEGIMLPMVGKAAEVTQILAAVKYAPEGIRGVAVQVSHDRFRPGNVARKLEAANRRSTVFCQIETGEGVKNAEAIAKTPGVDCLWVGQFDLSASLGVAGQFDSAIYAGALDRVVAAAKKHKKSLGTLVTTVEQGIAANKLGFDFICYSGDAWILRNALAEAVEKLRTGCGDGGNPSPASPAKRRGRA